MKLVYLAFAALLAIAGASTWFAFQNPSFVAGLAAVVAHAIWIAFVPYIMKRKSAAEEALDREAVRENVIRPDKFRRHPGER